MLGCSGSVNKVVWSCFRLFQVVQLFVGSNYFLHVEKGCQGPFLCVSFFLNCVWLVQVVFQVISSLFSFFKLFWMVPSCSGCVELFLGCFRLLCVVYIFTFLL